MRANLSLIVAGMALLVALTTAFAVAAWVVNPVEEAADHVAEPIGQSIGVLSTQCPSGWDYEPPRIGSEVATVPECHRDGYIARLDPVDKETCQTVFDSGSKTREGKGEITCTEAGFPQ